MVRAGDIISSPVTGTTYYFTRTAADTNGRLLAYEIHAEPNGTDVLPPHVHPRQEEHFEVLVGRVTFTIGGRTHTLLPGDSILVPAGVAHFWRNSGHQTALVLAEIEPAGHMETIIETLCATSRDRRFVSTSGSRLNPIPLAVMLDTYRGHVYFAGIPVVMQKLAFAALASIGRAQGYKSEYAYFDCVPEAEREVSIMLA